jgi:hypothetical protein
MHKVLTFDQNVTSRDRVVATTPPYALFLPIHYLLS